jgi:hypothetical protein
MKWSSPLFLNKGVIMSELVLDIGKFYKNRKGAILQVTEGVHEDHPLFKYGFRFTDELGLTYLPNGRYTNRGQVSDAELDLIEEVDPQELYFHPEIPFDERVFPFDQDTLEYHPRHPYIEPHQGREITLMIAGHKPCAMFTGGELPKDAQKVIELCGWKTNISILDHNILIALPGEEWRMDAIRLAYEHLDRTGKGLYTCSNVIGRALGYRPVDVEQFILRSELLHMIGPKDDLHKVPPVKGLPKEFVEVGSDQPVYVGGTAEEISQALDDMGMSTAVFTHAQIHESAEGCDHVTYATGDHGIDESLLDVPLLPMRITKDKMVELLTEGTKRGVPDVGRFVWELSGRVTLDKTYLIVKRTASTTPENFWLRRDR